ncbi:thyroid receptor-interacting protein 6 isoform X1 [Lepisosteus oculatus]|uniref:thyroid receptor-interacting protein 6 isoform X1 n=1 Tax=Lepisosteus oculatus TaxID=7918 RepID=UPI0037142331
MMSGPTWLPPRTLASPERPIASVSSASPAFYRPPKKVAAETNSKYGHFDQNSGGGVGMATRYMATGPTGGMMPHKHQEDPGPTAFCPLSPQSGDHYYPSSSAGKEERPSWSSQMSAFDLQSRASDRQGAPLSSIDAEIDSLTSMLVNMESHPQTSRSQVYDNMPYAKQQADRYKPTMQPGASAQGKPTPAYHHASAQYHRAPQYASGSPVSSSQSPQSSQYSPGSAQQAYPYSSQGAKPYPQPVPASYTTASTPTGPRFSIQVKTAQPVSTYSQTGRQAEQAYAPSPPRQPASRPLQERNPGYPDPGQAWYRPPPPLQPRDEQESGYRGGAPSAAVPRASQTSLPTRSPEALPPAPNQGYQQHKGAITRPEEELDRLTKKLVYDMNHPPAEEYFGRCARCGENVLGDGTGCVAMEQVFHVDCFSCITCHTRLRGQPFYAVDKKSYCESCYISTLERCSKCLQPVLDRILRAMGKAYHPRCFTCVVCGRCLDGVPFTVDATSQIHCIEDFHRKFAPRCSVCNQAIMPEPGQEETVRIVALDRSFHVNCYTCEECGLLLSSEGEGRGCYPLDGHILCKSCSARRIQDLSAKISTDC